MSNNIEVELERAKIRNYILEKENEIIMGNIGVISRDKEELIKQNNKLVEENAKIKEENSKIKEENLKVNKRLKNIKNSRSYRIYSKFKRLGKRK